MPRVAKSEREVAQKHPVAFPIIVVSGLMVIVILVLGYFLYQTVAENTRLKQKYQGNTNSVDNYEDNEGQQIENNLEGL